MRGFGSMFSQLLKRFPRIEFQALAKRVPHPVPWTVMRAVTRPISGDTWIWAAPRSQLLSHVGDVV